MKERIKKSAIRQFYKKGYFGTGMSTIAGATGIRKSSIYYHYPTKEDILLDIFKTSMNDLLQELQTRLQAAKNAKERMAAAIFCHIIFHIERQKEAIIADSELRGLTSRNYKEIIQMRDDYEKRFQHLIQEGVDEGVFAVADVKVISYAILSMCTAVCTWFSRSGRLSKEEVAEIYAAFILKALAA